MAHTIGRPLIAVLVASLTVLAPSAASASAQPHPPYMERFYCHRLVHPVAMHGYPWQLPNRAFCLPRPASRGADSQIRPPAHATG
jgi:hypothetical protein